MLALSPEFEHSIFRGGMSTSRPEMPATDPRESALRIFTPLLVSALLVSALPAVAQETGGVRITPEAKASAVGLARPLPSVQAVTYWPLNLPGYWQRPSACFNQRPFVHWAQGGRWMRAWRSSRGH